MTLKTVTEYRVNSEQEAKELIENAKKGEMEGYKVIKSSQTYKVKKSKGEIIDECYAVSITKEYRKVWDI